MPRRSASEGDTYIHTRKCTNFLNSVGTEQVPISVSYYINELFCECTETSIVLVVKVGGANK